MKILSMMSYCAANISFWTIWYHGGFNNCFADTIKAIILALLMGICGFFEIRMYRKFGTRLEPGLLRPVPKLYVVQMCLSGIILTIQPVRLGVRFLSTVYGHQIFLDSVETVVWGASISMIFIERNFDLPAAPGRGHSIYLNIFWGSALAVDTLEFVNVGGDEWFFQADSASDVALLTLFIGEWLCAIGLFILGLKAPGIVSNKQRNQFYYQSLDEQPKGYGSVSDESMDSTLDLSNGGNVKQSVDQLRASLNNGSLAEGFRQLARQSTDEVKGCVYEAKKAENEMKNRYWNVLPYDQNRVVLNRRTQSTDYINASWIEIRLPELDLINRYIATQGPKPETTEDFWEMVMEKRVPVIVMLTETVENNVRKCHEYWPKDCMEFGQRLVVSCTHVEQLGKFCTIREFLLIHLETKDQWSTVQLQFHGWPDHGAPKETKKFLEFWKAVRNRLPERRVLDRGREMEWACPPLLVHCSAGVGRSGAYIVMETLILEIESEGVLNPVELVRNLRDQRMAMVQTEEQFLFACKTAIDYYTSTWKKR